MEIQDLNLPLNAVQITKRLSHPDPRIDELIRLENMTDGEETELSELFGSYNDGVFDEIGRANPHLHWGVLTFINAFVELNDPQNLFAARSALIHQYDNFRTILRPGI